MSEEKNILKFAFAELSKMINDMKDGKPPEPSDSLKKIMNGLSELQSKPETQKLSDDEIKQWADKLLQQTINNSDKEKK